MLKQCIYGGVSDTEVHNCHVIISNDSYLNRPTKSLPAESLPAESLPAEDQAKTVKTLLDTLSKSTESTLCSIFDRQLKFIGWRLIITDVDQLHDSDISIVAANFYGDHVVLLFNNSTTLIVQEIRPNYTDTTTPHVLDLRIEEKIQGISCTDSLLVLYTEQGSLWTVSNAITNPCPQNVLLSGRKVRQVSCGKEHTAILTTLGQVYTFGGGSRGQLGHGGLESSATPQLVEKLSGIYSSRVEAGGWHTLVLSDIGDVYSWGWNESGQVGVSCMKDTHGEAKSPSQDGLSMIVYPVLLFEDDTEMVITDISCGSRHSAAITDDCQLYTWGWNGYGQLYLPDNVIVQDNPKLVKASVYRFRKIRCGGWSSFAFTDGDDDEQPTRIDNN